MNRIGKKSFATFVAFLLVLSLSGSALAHERDRETQPKKGKNRFAEIIRVIRGFVSNVNDDISIPKP